MPVSHSILKRITQRYIVLVLNFVVSAKDVGYLEIQHETKLKPVPLARALKLLAGEGLVTRHEIGGGRVHYKPTKYGVQLSKELQVILAIISKHVA